MTHSTGYIKLFRTLREQPWYADSEAVHLFVHLLLNATHTEREYLAKGQPVTLRPGQLITGRKALSLNTGINESKVQRLLKMFERCGQIEQQTNNLNRCISIVSWHKFQEGEQPANNQRTTSEQPANNQRTQNKNDNNYKNEKEGGESAPLSPKTIEFDLMKKIGKPAAKLWTEGEAARQFVGEERSHLALQWLEVLCKFGKPLLTQIELSALAKLMNAHSPGEIKKLIEYSAGKYPHLYPDRLDRLKKQNGQKAQPSKIIDDRDFDKYRKHKTT